MKLRPAWIIAVLRTICIETSRNNPSIVRVLASNGGSQCLVGKRTVVKRHSITAAAFANVYADPLLLNKKEEIDAVLGLYSAVVQNSRKWNMQRKVTNKGARHAGLLVWRRMMRDIVTERIKVVPRRNARRAIPESDLEPDGP